MKQKKLRISQKTTVKVHMGYRVMEIVIRMPIRRIAEQAVKAAFGTLATVKNGRAK